MKKLIFILLLLGFLSDTYCGDTAYYATLRKSLKQADVAYKTENFQQLANSCQRILNIYRNEWLPYYYGAYAYTNLCFIEKNTEMKDKYCDNAQSLIDSAFKIQLDESEIYVLQSLLYIARMSINPLINGPVYMLKASNALDEAEKLNPDNPRIYYLKGKTTLYTPKFFGGGEEAALPYFEKASLFFQGFNPESTVHPYWGKGDTERLLKKCKSDKE